VEVCYTAGQTTEDITLRMRFACWIPKATNTHSENVILITFLLNYGDVNTPQCSVMSTLPNLLCVKPVGS